jgi:hypothetical protein
MLMAELLLVSKRKNGHDSSIDESKRIFFLSFFFLGFPLPPIARVVGETAAQPRLSDRIIADFFLPLVVATGAFLTAKSV